VRQAKQATVGTARFSRVFARDSIATELFSGCPVITADGCEIGQVDALLVDKKTHRLRYVVLSSKTAEDASVVIPWQALYFDSALSRLVFYTFSTR